MGTIAYNPMTGRFESTTAGIEGGASPSGDTLGELETRLAFIESKSYPPIRLLHVELRANADHGVPASVVTAVPIVPGNSNWQPNGPFGYRVPFAIHYPIHAMVGGHGFSVYIYCPANVETLGALHLDRCSMTVTNGDGTEQKVVDCHGVAPVSLPLGGGGQLGLADEIDAVGADLASNGGGIFTTAGGAYGCDVIGSINWQPT